MGVPLQIPTTTSAHSHNLLSVANMRAFTLTAYNSLENPHTSTLRKPNPRGPRPPKARTARLWAEPTATESLPEAASVRQPIELNSSLVRRQADRST